MVSVTDRRGFTTTHGYDAAGRMTSTRDAVHPAPGLPLMGRGYDAAGRVAWEEDGKGRRTSFTYGARGLRTRTDFPDGSFETTTYDGAGRQVARTERAAGAAGVTTTYAYDAAGNLTGVSNLATGESWSYGYDEQGNLTSITDPEAHTRTFAFDAMGRETSRRFHIGPAQTRRYDAMNRLTSRTTPLGTQVSMSYAPTGRRASATDARGPTRYGYDGSDRLSSLTFPDGRSLSFTYDDAGNLTARTASTLDRTWTETYTYDAVGRPTSVSTVDPFTGTSYTYGMSYDGTGQLDALTYPNGLVVDYTYDALDQVTSIELESAGAVVRAWDYIRNADGNISSVTETSGAATPVITDYTYDGANRLITATQSQGASTLDAWAFEYDGAGNREEVTYTPAGGAAQLRTAMYDARDRLLSDGTTAFTWDDDGRMQSRSGADGFSQLVWDAEDRLLRMVHADGTVADFTYDVDGVLMQTDVAWPTGTSSTTRYLVDTSRGLSHIVADIDLSPGTGPGVTETTYARVGDMLLGSFGGAGPRFTHGDHLGSVRAVSDASGSIVGDYRYSPYGLLEQVQGEGPGAYRFAGERFGPLGVLSQNRARWMDPRMGAFLSMDPFCGAKESPVTMQRYSYAGAEPIRSSDPTGMLLNTGFSPAPGLVGNVASVTAQAGSAAARFGLRRAFVAAGFLGGTVGL